LSYQTTPVWIEGSVVRFQHVNPHTLITLENRSADGKVQRWTVEGPPQAALDRRDAEVRAPIVGDRLRFCAFPYKPAAELSRIWPGIDFSTPRRSETIDGTSPRVLAGHVMVWPDGTRQLWEPHGVLGECVRSSNEPRQTWINLLDSNAGARDSWCMQRRNYSAARLGAELGQLIEEINSSLRDPCR
jgi:hypothetical protein